MRQQNPTLTVGALRALLEQFPDDTPIAYRRMSEWEPLTADDIGLSDTPMFNNGGYVSRVYRPKDGAQGRSWLLFPGH